MKRLLFVALVLLSTISTPPGPAAAARGEVLARGAALHGANGLMFDRLDRLYIASVGGREIVVMDPQTGAILDRLGPAQGVEGTDDLTFGPDGALYWTSFFTGAVGRRAPDGTTTTIAQSRLASARSPSPATVGCSSPGSPWATLRPTRCTSLTSTAPQRRG
jgi:hypothetical protein